MTLGAQHMRHNSAIRQRRLRATSRPFSQVGGWWDIPSIYDRV